MKILPPWLCRICKLIAELLEDPNIKGNASTAIY